MSTPFLLAYSMTVIRALIERGQLVLGGSAEDAAKDLAAFLAAREGHSLISSTSRGLLLSVHVEELYAEDDEIKAIVDDLGTN